MLTFVFGIIDAFLPILIMFFVFRIIVGILRSILGSSRPIPEQSDDAAEKTAAEPAELVKKFEKKLRAKTVKKAEDNIVTDAETAVYKEQQDLLGRAEAQTAQPAFKAAVQEQPVKKRFVHRRLAEGFIMGQILDKPRSIKPYEDSF